MMYQQVIARRYARGLMMAAPESELDKIEQEFSELNAVLADVGSDLVHLFSDPAFFPSEKKAVIQKMAERYGFTPVFTHFLGLLVDKGRLKLLPLMYQSFVVLMDGHHGRLRALIKSAAPVDKDMLTDITAELKKICKKEILADVAVDKSLLAGLRVEIGGMVIDGSAKAKLAVMKNRLVDSIEAVSV